ncbi:MAG: hypothetical protein MUO80_06875 [Dehalococcoidia bacterium]|nr:hypothetical protein [Dehalococcoidia bacterium]
MIFLKGLYVVAIAVALIFLVIVGVETFYPAPQYPDSFFIVLPLGAAFAVVGTFIRRRLDIFGAGLILGGIGTMIFALTPYDLDNILRFAGIAATLAVLLFVGYKVFLSLKRS